MRFPRKRGSTSVMVRVFIPNNSVSTGAGLSGLTNSSTNLTIEYMRELDSAVTSYSGANIEAQTTVGTYQAPSTSSKIRFKETAIAGVYELQFHDSATAFGTGDTSQNILINIREATTTALNIGPNGVLIPLVPWDYQDGVRMGLTALPNAAAEAAGGLYTRGTGAGQINQAANGQIDTRTASTNIVSGVRKNVAKTFMVYMVLSSDHATAATGKTLTVTASKDQGSFNAIGTPTEISGGWYKIAFAQADMNCDELAVDITEASCDKRAFVVETVS